MDSYGCRTFEEFSSSLPPRSREDARKDLFWALDAAPQAVPGLLWAISQGRIDGDYYGYTLEVGDRGRLGTCSACVMGTIANEINVGVRDMVGPLQIDVLRPLEHYFRAIKPGRRLRKQPLLLELEAMILEWLTRHYWKEVGRKL